MCLCVNLYVKSNDLSHSTNTPTLFSAPFPVWCLDTHWSCRINILPFVFIQAAFEQFQASLKERRNYKIYKSNQCNVCTSSSQGNRIYLNETSMLQSFNLKRSHLDMTSACCICSLFCNGQQCLTNYIFAFISMHNVTNNIQVKCC